MFCIFVGVECATDFDLVFVIDGSGSIEHAGVGNFKKIKDFIKDIVNGFNIGFDKTHVGALIFSSSVKKVFGLDEHYSKSGINSAIDKVIYPSGGTYTGKALRMARKKMYTKSGDREDKPNVVIVITDGKANDDVEGPTNQLRNLPAAIFAIGVGTNFDRAELEKIAGSSANVFTADFDNLGQIIENIKQSVGKERRSLAVSFTRD
ncbi:unnamed protein product [Porites evermanni]|uniref:VWFA domain-containing protein n=1 Tax=Porites evermanni TaxID=104178 RepID=A0ABN8STU1_9CNID|nr:unnamed protein product [Porites evermanni]